MTTLQSRHFQASQLRGVNRDARTVEIVASDFSLDSFGTRIDPNGWDLDQFKKNPVICLQHDSYSGLPVASAIPESIRVENARLVMTPQFPPEGTTDDADEAFGLIAAGVLRGVSVGFEPLEWEDTTEKLPDGQEIRVRVYKKQRLMEVSFVTIPSNDNGLVVRAKELNADAKQLRARVEELEASLEAKHGEPQVLVKKSVWDKYEGYFNSKQKANRASTKVLEKFYRKVLKADPPSDEIDAWARMGEAVEALEEKPKADETPAEPPVETVTVTAETTIDVKPEEPLPEPTIEETKEETPPLPPIPAPVPEAPEPERKASVQIPVEALLAFPERMTKALTDAAAAALRSGVPLKDVGTLIDGLSETVATSFTHIRHGTHS